MRVTSPPPEATGLSSAISLLGRSIDVMINANERLQIESLMPDDVAIDVPMGDIGTSDFTRIPEAVELGRRAADGMRAELGRYSVPEAEYAAWVASLSRTQAPETALAEVYRPPLPGYGPRGGDIGADGVFWTPLSSGHLASFDRRKCKVTNGPGATGKHCPEGWTLHRFPGPQMPDVKDPGSAETSYYVWVDWFGILGLGKNVPIAMGNGSDSILPTSST